jgi:monosaccharide-transporting ATPase
MKSPVCCAPFMSGNRRFVIENSNGISKKAGETYMEQKVVLTMRDISKTFPGVKALQHVDFTLREGEIHALMGENGAGKSTLIKVLTGVHDFEAGEIKMAGNDMSIVNRSPQDAQNNGISTVYQEVNLCPNLTVAENLFIGREPRKAGFIDWKTMNKKSSELLSSLDIDANAADKLEECSLAKQQMIAIARAVDMKCKVLILDEPTSSLDDDEVEKLFVLMRRLRGEGVGIIFVTHFLEQVYAVCDRITVLRNGELVGEYETKDLPRVMLVAKMMGKDFDDLADIKSAHGKLKEFVPVIEAEGIGRKGSIRPFDFTVHKGEVVGLTGLLGSGRSELVRAIYGADKPDSGKIKVNGKEVKIGTPLDAMKLGMAYLPEDRKKDGIIADLSVRENIIIALQAKKGMFKLMSRKEMEEAADKYIEMLQVKTASRETPIKSLSGGNQQKVIIGRWLLTNPEYLILDEPTRGIDIGTKTEIQKLVLDLADKGMAVTFISSEVEEMLRTCSRMGVLRDGKKVGELAGDELTQEGIMKAIAGGDGDE